MTRLIAVIAILVMIIAFTCHNPSQNKGYTALNGPVEIYELVSSVDTLISEGQVIGKTMMYKKLPNKCLDSTALAWRDTIRFENPMPPSKVDSIRMLTLKRKMKGVR